MDEYIYRGCAGWTFFPSLQNLKPFSRLGSKGKAALRATYHPLWFASLLTTVESVGHDFSSSLQMQRNKRMLQLACIQGFMYIESLSFASFTDTSTLMAWNIRYSKDAAFCAHFSVSLKYLRVKDQHANVSGWEQRTFSVCCKCHAHAMICFG